MSKEPREVQHIHAGADASSRTIRRTLKLRRNDPCPCGSGKKVKNCCGVQGEYTYDRFRPIVVEEHQLKAQPSWPYEIGEKAVISDKFPKQSLHGLPVTIVTRGYAENVATCYFRIVFDNPEVEHKPTVWIADYCLDKVEEGGAK